MTRERRAWIALVGAAVLVRGIAFWQASSTPLLDSWRWDQSDMGFFRETALRIVDGDPLLDGTFQPAKHAWRRTIAREYLRRHPEAGAGAAGPEEAERRLWESWLPPKVYYQEPLYTYALAATLTLPGRDVRWMIVLQMIAGVGTVVLVGAVARRCFGEAAGITAGVLALLYAPLPFYELVLLRATLIVLAGTALVLVWLRTIERDRASAWLGAGLLTGVAILLKSVFVPFAAAGILHAAVARRDGRWRAGRAARSAGAAAGGVLLALLPLIARNVAVGAAPFALAAPGLANLLFGLGPGVSPHPGASTYDFASFGEIMARTGGAVIPSVKEMLRMYGSAGAFLGVLARKLLSVWNWYEIPNNVNFDYFEPRIGVLRALPLRFIVLAPLGLVGAALAGRSALRRWPLFLAPLTAIAVLTVFANNSRTRLPLAVALMPFAAHALVRIVGRLRARSWARAAIPLAATVALAAAMSGDLPPGTTRIRSADHVLALEAHYLPDADAAEAAGDPGRAADVLREAVRQAPAWVRDPARLGAPTPQERVLGAMYLDVHRRCATDLERAGRSAEAATYRDLARRLEAALR